MPGPTRVTPVKAKPCAEELADSNQSTCPSLGDCDEQMASSSDSVSMPVAEHEPEYASTCSFQTPYFLFFDRTLVLSAKLFFFVEVHAQKHLTTF